MVFATVNQSSHSRHLEAGKGQWSRLQC